VKKLVSWSDVKPGDAVFHRAAYPFNEHTHEHVVLVLSVTHVTGCTYKSLTFLSNNLEVLERIRDLSDLVWKVE
jgi:hypothetical protein